MALQGFHAVRAYSGGAGGERGPARGARVRAGRRRLGGARRAARRPLHLRRGAGRARPAGGGERPPRRLGLDPGGAAGLAREGGRRRRPADAGDRPLLLPLDLLPRAERRPLRDRHPGPGLHRRRAGRAPRREALAAARLRAPARRGRTEAAAGRQPAGQSPGLTPGLRLARRRADGRLPAGRGGARRSRCCASTGSRSSSC